MVLVEMAKPFPPRRKSPPRRGGNPLPVEAEIPSPSRRKSPPRREGNPLPGQKFPAQYLDNPSCETSEQKNRLVGHTSHLLNRSILDTRQSVALLGQEKQ